MTTPETFTVQLEAWQAFCEKYPGDLTALPGYLVPIKDECAFSEKRMERRARDYPMNENHVAALRRHMMSSSVGERVFCVSGTPMVAGVREINTLIALVGEDKPPLSKTE